MAEAEVGDHRTAVVDTPAGAVVDIPAGAAAVVVGTVAAVAPPAEVVDPQAAVGRISESGM